MVWCREHQWPPIFSPAPWDSWVPAVSRGSGAGNLPEKDFPPQIGISALAPQGISNRGFRNRISVRRRKQYVERSFTGETEEIDYHFYLPVLKEKVDYMTFQMRIDEERDEAREEGRKEGLKEERHSGIRALIATMKELSVSQTQAVEQVMKRYSLSHEDAVAVVQTNW